jgi:phospholipase/lecithinase/hemolysin
MWWSLDVRRTTQGQIDKVARFFCYGDAMRQERAIAVGLMLALAACSSGGGGGSASTTPLPGSTSAPPQASAPTPSAAPVSALFVLGDSLSDVGNAAGAADYVLGKTIAPPTVGLCNPFDVLVLSRGCEDVIYRKSRVSDGPVAVEHLATGLGVAALGPSFHVLPSRPSVGTNYAVASAKGRAGGVEDLGRQVDVLLLDQASLATEALFVVIIGGNDAIDALQAANADGPTADASSAAIVTAAVGAIGDSLERLLDYGARRLVVANIPDLAALPSVRATAQSSATPAAVLAAATAVTDDFDRELAARLDVIAASHAWDAPQPPVIVRFDLRAELAAVQQAAEQRGENATDACFDSDAYRASAVAARHFHPDCAPLPGGAPRFAGFVFWDDIHPTGATHAAIGAALVAAVKAELHL